MLRRAERQPRRRGSHGDGPSGQEAPKTSGSPLGAGRIPAGAAELPVGLPHSAARGTSRRIWPQHRASVPILGTGTPKQQLGTPGTITAKQKGESWGGVRQVQGSKQQTEMKPRVFSCSEALSKGSAPRGAQDGDNHPKISPESPRRRSGSPTCSSPSPAGPGALRFPPWPPH